jgi:hypothetical protein
MIKNMPVDPPSRLLFEEDVVKPMVLLAPGPATLIDPELGDEL